MRLTVLSARCEVADHYSCTGYAAPDTRARRPCECLCHLDPL